MEHIRRQRNNLLNVLVEHMERYNYDSGWARDLKADSYLAPGEINNIAFIKYGVNNWFIRCSNQILTSKLRKRIIKERNELEDANSDDPEEKFQLRMSIDFEKEELRKLENSLQKPDIEEFLTWVKKNTDQKEHIKFIEKRIRKGEVNLIYFPTYLIDYELMNKMR